MVVRDLLVNFAASFLPSRDMISLGFTLWCFLVYFAARFGLRKAKDAKTAGVRLITIIAPLIMIGVSLLGVGGGLYWLWRVSPATEVAQTDPKTQPTGTILNATDAKNPEFRKNTTIGTFGDKPLYNIPGTENAKIVDNHAVNISQLPVPGPDVKRPSKFTVSQLKEKVISLQKKLASFDRKQQQLFAKAGANLGEVAEQTNDEYRATLWPEATALAEEMTTITGVLPPNEMNPQSAIFRGRMLLLTGGFSGATPGGDISAYLQFLVSRLEETNAQKAK